MSVSPAGFVVVAVAALLLGYLVPALIRRRQTVGDARVPDRFSTALRVVERREAPTSGGASTEALIRSTPHPVIERREESTVNRPAGMAERRTAAEARRVAAVRAALAARRAEQAAAARRRLVLTLVVLAVTVLAWLAVAVASFQWYLALFPTIVLGATLYLGTRAAQAERAEWAQVPESLRAPRSATASGPSYSPSQLRAHLRSSGPAEESEGSAAGLRWDTGELSLGVQIEVDAEDGAAPADATSDVAAPGTWTPVPVPVPTYTLKSPAPRREVAPAETTETDAASTQADLAPHEHPEEAAGSAATDVLDALAGDAPSIDLNAVLARRRAV